MAGSGCNAYQIRKIYAIGGALGMVKRNEEDDLLHELVEGMTGKKSIKALTYGEACKVIGELEGRQGTPPPRKSGKPLRKTAPGHTSEGQRRKVWALMYRLQDASPSKAPLGDRLCAIIKKELGMDAFPKDPFAWISYKDGNKLVEVLKYSFCSSGGKLFINSGEAVMRVSTIITLSRRTLHPASFTIRLISFL